jgi:signal peptidase I
MSSNPFLKAPAEAGSRRSLPTDIILVVVIGLTITALTYLFILVPSQVDGKSMEPNFFNGEIVISNKLIHILGNTGIGERFNYNYKRGDVVVFKKPDREKSLIKRIIAIPGDTLMFQDKKFIVNGQTLFEDYIPDTRDFETSLPSDAFITEGREVTVPDNKYFVVGDNRRNSTDSRFEEIGWVDRSEMQGKTFLIFWPVSRFSLVKHADL